MLWQRIALPGLIGLILFSSGIAQPLHLRFDREIRLFDGGLSPKSRLFAVSVNRQGDIYLLDQGLNRIFQLDEKGKILREVGGFGWEVNQFDRPMDIWGENALDVFVADYNNHRIQRFDRHLNFVASYESDSRLDDKLQFALPISVAFSRFGELFVLEQEHFRVLRFNRDGMPEQSFGDYDWGAGTLQEPVSLCLSENDRVYVADRGRRAVVCFDYYGNYLSEISHQDLQQPGDIQAVLRFLFVVDEATDRIWVFDEQGKPVVDFAPHALASASDTHLDLAVRQNVLYILDASAARILCYNILPGRK